MIRHYLMVSAIALALASAAPATAGTYVRPLNSGLPIQTVGCAIGAHIGPLGACVIGTDDPAPAPVVIEQRVDAPPADVTTTKTVTQDANGCTTKTIVKTDDMGNSAAKSKSNC